MSFALKLRVYCSFLNNTTFHCHAYNKCILDQNGGKYSLTKRHYVCIRAYSKYQLGSSGHV